ncbi:MAG TPA: hypothetical protein VGC45_07115 [Gryllotalpicola sp.]
MSTRHKLAIATAAVLTVIALSGCSGAQSKADACKSVRPTVNTAIGNINTAVSGFSSDPAAALTKLQSTDASYKKGLTKISNPEIKKKSSKAEKTLASFIGDVKAFVADPTSDSSALQKSSTTLQTDFGAIQKSCTS